MLPGGKKDGSSRVFLPAAVILIVGGALFLHALLYWGWTEDDAYITYRYAENQARGEGLVFNSGERVEGYSNFLWVMMISAGIRSGISPEFFSRSAGIAAALAAMLISYLLARRLCPRNRLIPFIAPVYIAASPFLTRHAVSGLETSFFAALTAGALLASAGGRNPAQRALLIILLVLISLTRVEGPAVAILILGGRAIFREGGKLSSRFREVFLFEFLPYLITFGTYYIWRWNYFRDPVANTFYAKMGGGFGSILRGGRYTAEFIRDSGGALIVGLAAVPAVFRRRSRLFKLCSLVVVFYTAFIIISGGDWMFYYRFYAHILPVLVPLVAAGLCCILSVRECRKISTPRLRAVAGISLAAIFLVTAAAEKRIAGLVLPAVRDHNYLSQNYREMAGWFRENTDPEATVAISDVGAFAYFSNRRVLDLFELVTRNHRREKGHSGFENRSEYILARDPDYIVLM
ncbi:MAG: hypothetical protein GF417_08730, partial [Candidatus Latescibacteria bacterium]|nr:hypothetical protein [bacterium]MBD3424506.1 hypothetical protein [Candidatus Latescibacterota bacterium]